MREKIITAPNIITTTRGIAGIIGIILVVQFEMFVLGASMFFLLGMMPDCLDGWVARKYDQQSRLGEMLDPFVDKSLFYGALFVVFIEFVWLPALYIILICDVISTYLHFTQSGGAVTCGKKKFVLQCISLGFFTAAVLISKSFIAFANVTLILATIYAVSSLKQRFFN